MDRLIHWLRDAPLGQAVAVLLVENVLVFLLALLLGHGLIRRFAHRRVALPAPPLARLEVAVAASNVLLNTVVTLIGLFLWRAGVVTFRTDTGLWAVLDVFVLLLVMDFAMYWLHRTAHHRLLYPILHRLHHVFDRPRPLTLFVLNPVENIAFGALWLVVIVLYPASWVGMSVYLALNVLFGTIGHLGVEPLPPGWARVPGLRNVAGSTFHARHHQNLACNFGFYTLIWDRLFGTLGADYWDSFGGLPGARPDL
ncbi:MAG TPA: sterol desaturase family protein [Gemmata sp.]